MNPLAALRDLLAVAAEGKQMELLGPDFRQRRAREEAETQRIIEQIAMDRENHTIAGRRAENEHTLRLRELRMLSERPYDQPVSGDPSIELPGPPGPAPDPMDEFVNPLTGDRTAVRGGYRDTSRMQEVADLMAGGEAKTTLAVEQARQVGALPATLTAGSRKILGAGPDEALTDEDIAIRTGEQNRRATIAAASARATGGGSGGGIDSATITDVANRYASGELTVDQARSSLGGVHGMAAHGPAFWAAVGDRRGMTPVIRKEISKIQSTRNLLDNMEELVGQVVNAKDGAKRAEATLMLEQFGQTVGTLISKGFGEGHQVTDRDVTRATGLVPGWKAANFAPEYAYRELALMRDVLDRSESGILSINTRQFDRQGNTVGGPPPAADGSYQMDGYIVRPKRR